MLLNAHVRALTPPCGTPSRPQDKLQDRAPGAFGGYRGGRREAGLLAAACEAYAGGAGCKLGMLNVELLQVGDVK